MGESEPPAPGRGLLRVQTVRFSGPPGRSRAPPRTSGAAGPAARRAPGRRGGQAAVSSPRAAQPLGELEGALGFGPVGQEAARLPAHPLLRHARPLLVVADEVSRPLSGMLLSAVPRLKAAVFERRLPSDDSNLDVMNSNSPYS
jgi:hypothetical protein